MVFPGKRQGTTAEHPKTALVIDDSAPVRAVVAHTLGKRGYQVFEAATAAEALAIIVSNNISIAIGDLHLERGTSGIALLEQALRLRPGLKCILMSGALAPGKNVRTPFPILSKPFAPEALIDLADRLLEKVKQEGESPL